MILTLGTLAFGHGILFRRDSCSDGHSVAVYTTFLLLDFCLCMRKDTMTKNNDNQNCQYMTRRIGSTTYKVKVVFSDNGGETMEEKILRMIRNEGLQNGEERGMMDAPQMSRQSERSAS